MTTEGREKVEVVVYKEHTTTCDERILMHDESGQDTSNTPPSCLDEGKVKKKEGKRERRNKEGRMMVIWGAGQHQGLSDVWRMPETVVVS